MWIEIVGFIVLVLVSLYCYVRHQYTFWSSRSVPGPVPSLIGGNLFTRIRRSPANLDPCWLQRYGSVYGVYNGLRPSLVVHEPAMIKQLLVRDFGCFVNRSKLRTFHPLWNANLIFAEDEQWRRVRRIAGAAFTAGRLRRMAPLMGDCVGKLIHYLDHLILNEGGVVDTKPVVAGFTIDVVATTSFGTETDANGDRNTTRPQNRFLLNGYRLFRFDPARVGAAFTLPKWALRLIGLRTFFDPGAFQFFVDYTRHILHQRRTDPSAKREDLVQLLLDATDEEPEEEEENESIGKTEFMNNNDDNEEPIKKNEALLPQKPPKSPKPIKPQSARLTENEIIAQCIAFFVAGFETTASAISHCLFELAQNQEIQHKLSLEIEQALASVEHDHEQQTTTTTTTQLYSSDPSLFTDLPYLDAVVRETLRHYPPLTRLSRVTTADHCTLGNIELPRGTAVEVPVYAIHHWPQYYPNPDRFDPERFMPANRAKLVPYTYLPFGAGPRNCIGARFALQEIKLAVANLVERFRFSLTPDTPTRLRFKDAGNPQLTSFVFPLHVGFR